MWHQLEEEIHWQIDEVTQSEATCKGENALLFSLSRSWIFEFISADLLSWSARCLLTLTRLQIQERTSCELLVRWEFRDFPRYSNLRVGNPKVTRARSSGDWLKADTNTSTPGMLEDRTLCLWQPRKDECGMDWADLQTGRLFIPWLHMVQILRTEPSWIGSSGRIAS